MMFKEWKAREVETGTRLKNWFQPTIIRNETVDFMPPGVFGYDNIVHRISILAEVAFSCSKNDYEQVKSNAETQMLRQTYYFSIHE